MRRAMNCNIRPLHVGKFMPPPHAGVEAHIDTLLNSLSGYCYPTLLAARSPSRSNESLQPDYRSIRTENLGKFASATVSPSVVTKGIYELTSKRSNILHIHAPNPWADILALSAPRSVPVVVTWHSDIVRQMAYFPWYRKIQRAVLKRAEKVIFFTEGHYLSSTQAGGLPSSKVKFIPHGLNYDELTSTSIQDSINSSDSSLGDRDYILHVGRHVPYKGINYLLDAFSLAKTHALLVLVGAGELTSSFKRQVDSLGISERVRFLGEVDKLHLRRLYRNSAFFCLPSVERSEAFGIAACEAMAFGKPTLVCDLGNGVNYLNRHGETSIIVPPRNVAALSEAIDMLMDNVSLRNSMGMLAAEWVRKRFSLDVMRSETLSLYESII